MGLSPITQEHPLGSIQQTVSVNICSENLLSTTILGLKCAGKTAVFFNSDFRDMNMSVDFGEIKKCRFGYVKRPAGIFGKATAARKFGW